MVKYLVFKGFLCVSYCSPEQVIMDVAVQVTYPSVLFCKSFPSATLLLSSRSPKSASAVTHPSVLPRP